MEHSVISSAGTQRAVARESLFLGAKITISASLTPISTVVRNISAGGMMIDAPKRLTKDQRVTAHLRFVGDILGTVAWVRDGRAGVMFDTLIDPDDIRTTPSKGQSKTLATPRPSSLIAENTKVQVLIPDVGALSARIEHMDSRRLILVLDET